MLPTHSHRPVSDEFLFRSLRFDLLGASRLLDAIARSPGPQLTSEIIADMARDEGVSAERTRRLIDSFVDLRILERSTGIPHARSLAVGRTRGFHLPERGG